MLKVGESLTEHKRWKRNYTIVAVSMMVVLVVTAGVGLFGRGIYDDFAPPKYVQESRAQDLITLVLGLPMLAAALVGARREKVWSIPMWAGVLAYELYVYGIYAIGGVYNIFFFGYLAAASLAIYTIIGLLSSVDTGWFQRQVNPRMPRRWIAVFFLLIVAVFAFIWLGQVMQTIETGIVDSGHLIFVFDLMVVLPAFGITAFKLLRGQSIGDVLAGMMLIKFDSLCIAIALGQWFRWLNDITVEAELLGVFIPLGIVGLVFTWLYFKNLK